ncbi:MAG: hypothetical protein QGI09_10275, partial [Dehalococcoidia bacterium]|nr:hypothetical protein [Dehalococcoidia bacterium]
VMAGCKPEYFPAVIAGVRALLEPRFNLHGVQTTTHASVPLLIVNGPVRDRIGINYKHGVFGNGYRANGTIGRAIRLIQWNIGGSFPGDADQSTFAHPGKWTYCVGEWEEASPWEPFHVERGFSPETSTVTAFACDPPLTIRCHGTAKQILSPICQTMAIMGPNNLYYMGEVLLVISPREAQTFGEEGWTKQQVREHIWNQARVPMYKVRDTGVGDVAAFAGRRWPDWVDPHDDNCMVPLTRRPEDIHVLVCGGWGRFAAVCFSWGDLGGFATTKAVE